MYNDNSLNCWKISCRQSAANPQSIEEGSTTIHGSGVDYKCNRKSEHLINSDT